MKSALYLLIVVLLGTVQGVAAMRTGLSDRDMQAIMGGNGGTCGQNCPAAQAGCKDISGVICSSLSEANCTSSNEEKSEITTKHSGDCNHAGEEDWCCYYSPAVCKTCSCSWNAEEEKCEKSSDCVDHQGDKCVESQTCGET